MCPRQTRDCLYAVFYLLLYSAAACANFAGKEECLPFYYTFSGNKAPVKPTPSEKKLVDSVRRLAAKVAGVVQEESKGSVALISVGRSPSVVQAALEAEKFPIHTIWFPGSGLNTLSQADREKLNELADFIIDSNAPTLKIVSKISLIDIASTGKSLLEVAKGVKERLPSHLDGRKMPAIEVVMLMEPNRTDGELDSVLKAFKEMGIEVKEVPLEADNEFYKQTYTQMTKPGPDDTDIVYTDSRLNHLAPFENPVYPGSLLIKSKKLFVKSEKLPPQIKRSSPESADERLERLVFVKENFPPSILNYLPKDRIKELKYEILADGTIKQEVVVYDSPWVDRDKREPPSSSRILYFQQVDPSQRSQGYRDFRDVLGRY